MIIVNLSNILAVFSEGTEKDRDTLALIELSEKWITLGLYDFKVNLRKKSSYSYQRIAGCLKIDNRSHTCIILHGFILNTDVG